MSEKEPSFGLPKNWNEIPAEERKLLQKPLIFPNHEKRFKIFTAVATFAVTFYMVFYHEYKAKDHCFQPIRRWVTQQKKSFFTLRPEDMAYAEEYKQKLKANDC
ncbi:uncharacterized protein LOC124442641 [Xenia sp. Carnegie-2017]|uniref:uncharacterized protein LOC124442641 n=1 Tax=Xenia sp. Carnegie-2017 TaxID=2897299 RepID=UPI001F04CF70|nr:uncharacterized protein LOC124442641 [Xenia sp. Carnegie-2017]